MKQRHLISTLATAATLALICPRAIAQARPVAFTNARIHTVAGPVIERGTLVIKNGKIEAVGKDVTVPAGARVVDASGKTVMPGLVSAWSRAGLNPPQQQGRTPQRFSRRMRRMPRTSGRASNSAATKVVDRLYARQPIFRDLLEEGVTSLALNPVAGGFAGLGAVLDPTGKTLEQLTLDDDAFVQIGMVRNGSTKKLLKDTFAKAKKVVEDREKPPAAPKPEKKPDAKQPEQKKPEGKPAPKPGPKPEPQPNPQPKPQPKPTPKPTPKPKPGPEPKPQPKPSPKPGQDPKQARPSKPAPKKRPKDPNLEVLADLLQGKRRAIVQIDSAADLLHWRTAVSDDVEFPRVVAVRQHDAFSGTLDLVIDHLKKWKCAVLLPPTLTTKARTQYLVHPAKKLHDAGIELAFHVPETPSSVRLLFYQLMNLVRSGLPADVAIKGVTLAPAKALGIDKRTGTLEAGKDADLLLFSGDPLSPASKLEQVWLRGQHIEPRP